MIGYAFCGSFCTLEDSCTQLEKLVSLGYQVQPIMSETAYMTDTRFGTAEKWRARISSLCGKEIIHSIPMAEPLGPKMPLDMLIIAPCTGNTLAKMASGIDLNGTITTGAAHSGLNSFSMPSGHIKFGWFPVKALTNYTLSFWMQNSKAEAIKFWAANNAFLLGEG